MCAVNFLKNNFELVLPFSIFLMCELNQDIMAKMKLGKVSIGAMEEALPKINEEIAKHKCSLGTPELRITMNEHGIVSLQSDRITVMPRVYDYVVLRGIVHYSDGDGFEIALSYQLPGNSLADVGTLYYSYHHKTADLVLDERFNN